MSNSPWSHIFSTYDIINHIKTKNVKINAIDIKSCKTTYTGKTKNQFEPRLLCYQTTEKERPEIFKENNIYILPIKNGQYLLTKQKIFFKLNYNKKNSIKLKKDNTSLLNTLGDCFVCVINSLIFAFISD